MKTLLYFHPVGSTSWRPIVDGVKDIALKANWHVQEVNVPPTHHNLDELCQFWNPVGVIIDAGAGFGGISPSDLKLRPTVLIDPDPTLLPSGAFTVRHDSVATATLAAKELLSTTELSIKEIAYQLNFDSPDYFSAKFKAKTGRRPTELRTP